MAEGQFVSVDKVGGDEAWILFGSHNLLDAVAQVANLSEQFRSYRRAKRDLNFPRGHLNVASRVHRQDRRGLSEGEFAKHNSLLGGRHFVGFVVKIDWTKAFVNYIV